jgi:hypothetical protein
MNESGIVGILAKLACDADDEISHQGCGIIANIAKREENKISWLSRPLFTISSFSCYLSPTWSYKNQFEPM